MGHVHVRESTIDIGLGTCGWGLSLVCALGRKPTSKALITSLRMCQQGRSRPSGKSMQCRLQEIKRGNEPKRKQAHEVTCVRRVGIIHSTQTFLGLQYLVCMCVRVIPFGLYDFYLANTSSAICFI